MDLNEDNLAVVCITSDAIIRGRIHVRQSPVSTQPDPVVDIHPHTPRTNFVELQNATVLDHDRRILRRVPRLVLNPHYIIYFVEDDMAAQLDRIKTMITGEDYEGAGAELDRLLAVTSGDGELLYLAGVVNHNLGNEDRARELFGRALDVTLDEKLRAVIQRHLTNRD